MVDLCEMKLVNKHCECLKQYQQSEIRNCLLSLSKELHWGWLAYNKQELIQCLWSVSQVELYPETIVLLLWQYMFALDISKKVFDNGQHCITAEGTKITVCCLCVISFFFTFVHGLTTVHQKRRKEYFCSVCSWVFSCRFICHQSLSAESISSDIESYMALA